MSTNYSTTNQSYKHLSEAERGEIEAYLSVGLKPAEIARRLGRNRSTITREINRGSITQVKKVNGQKAGRRPAVPAPLPTGERPAEPEPVPGLCCPLPSGAKLDSVSDDFLRAFTEAMREKPRVHSVDTFVHTYRLQHVDAVVPSTKTLYNYIHQGLLEIKVIDLPRAVRIRKKFTKRPSTKKHLGKSIEERPEEINNRSRFGDWEIDSVLGGKTIGEPSILTLVERQTRYAVTKKLVEKKAEYVNQAVLECMKLYPIKSITADNGNEFSSLSKIEGLDVYFAHAYSSYERGTNENFNGLLREFIPKGCSLKELNQNLLEDYTKAINERPRRIHGYQSAKKLFELTQTA